MSLILTVKILKILHVYLTNVQLIIPRCDVRLHFINTKYYIKCTFQTLY